MPDHAIFALARSRQAGMAAFRSKHDASPTDRNVTGYSEPRSGAEHRKRRVGHGCPATERMQIRRVEMRQRPARGFEIVEEPRALHVPALPSLEYRGRINDWVEEIRKARDRGEITVFVAATLR